MVVILSVTYGCSSGWQSVQISELWANIQYNCIAATHMRTSVLSINMSYRLTILLAVYMMHIRGTILRCCQGFTKSGSILERNDARIYFILNNSKSMTISFRELRPTPYCSCAYTRLMYYLSLSLTHFMSGL